MLVSKICLRLSDFFKLVGLLWYLGDVSKIISWGVNTLQNTEVISQRLRFDINLGLSIDELIVRGKLRDKMRHPYLPSRMTINFALSLRLSASLLNYFNLGVYRR